jgi:UDP-N-acetylmuramoyl-L-alanyl-D-glutamate--2,6-diaminopimelate ligase
MTLQQLFRAVPEAVISGNALAEITGVECHSARVAAGNAFFAVRGFREDGNRFVAAAQAQGAAAIVSDSPPDRTLAAALPWVQVPDIRRALALAAAEYYRHPSSELQLVGVTGTNGKTTTAFLIASILDAARRRPALLGTIEYRMAFADEQGRVPAPNTTPESLELQRMLRRVVNSGGRAAVMEVSSHSLVLHRVTGCSFHTAVLTNVARDHLDFHGNEDEYFKAKSRLFLPPDGKPPQFAVLNADDARARELAARSPSKLLRFGIEQPAEVTASRWKAGRAGIELTVQTPAGPLEIASSMVGRHNVYNLLAAVAAALALQAHPDAIRKGIRNVSVPGRMEAIDEGQPFAVFVDYAHTEDALRNLVASARELAGAGHLILLFGCGGDRDRSKRPLMGLAASDCDEVILTSDNPRSEDPLQILNDVMVGLQKGHADYVVEPDRAAAIERALREARPGDTVLIAGKGHENYQIAGSQRLPFDDREVARAALRKLGFSANPVVA